MATTIAEEKKIAPTDPINGNGLENGLKESSAEVGSVEGLDILVLATDEHPAHPRHWPLWKRWAILFTLCSFQAFMFVAV